MQGNKNRNSSAVAWTALTAQSLGDLITPSPANGLVAVCSGAGTTGSSQPAWTTAPFPTLGTSFTDGTVTWTIIGTQPGAFAPIIQEPIDGDPPLAYAGVLPDTTLADAIAWIISNLGLLAGANTWSGTNLFRGSYLTSLVTITQQSSGVALTVNPGTGGNPGVLVAAGAGLSDGIDATGGSGGGHGFYGTASDSSYAGVYGVHLGAGPAVWGNSNSGYGVWAQSVTGPAIRADANATRGAIWMVPGSLPSTPSAGEIAFDSGTNQLAYYNGSAWVHL